VGAQEQWTDASNIDHQDTCRICVSWPRCGFLCWLKAPHALKTCDHITPKYLSISVVSSVTVLRELLCIIVYFRYHLSCQYAELYICQCWLCHLSDHSLRLFRSCCSVITSFSDFKLEYIFVSSANISTQLLTTSGRSFMYTTNRKDPGHCLEEYCWWREPRQTSLYIHLLSHIDVDPGGIYVSILKFNFWFHSHEVSEATFHMVLNQML